MVWEYKRALFPLSETVQQDKGDPKPYDKQAQLTNPEFADPVEESLNRLGSEGWEVVTVVNLYCGADSWSPVFHGIEYILKRERYDKQVQQA